MKKLTKLICIVIMLSLFSSLLTGCTSKGNIEDQPGKDQSTDAFAKPDMIILGSHELGTGGHRELGLVSEGINEHYDDLAVRLTPAGSEVSRLYLAREGDVFATTMDQPGNYCVNEGNFQYSNKEWGPQPLRSIYMTNQMGGLMGTRGDSGIESFEDLRGKKVPYIPAQAGMNIINEALLAYGGLTWDDVDVIEYSSSGAVYAAVVEGDLDAAFVNPSSSSAYEGVEHPLGWKWLPMPVSDTEAWERYQKVFPFQPRNITHGAGISEDNNIDGFTHAFPTLVAYENLEDEKAYWVTRAIIESRDSFKDKDKTFVDNWYKEQFMKIYETDFLPMHDGSIKYMKEIGLWTNEHDKMNQKRIEYQGKLKELWDELNAERIEKGMKDDEFNEYWMNKKVEAGYGLKYFQD